ncbi:MaoC family dehydratase N-terminal domain-containing protein [Sphingobium sp. V4]|uniref:FAS1-like dehydratase domain-containing protein n=1 Tax=Sphingobium sp. V4 TaxID=3038927 RepID=UPI002557FD48|nr:MaoC family dehydratase N-terminal domain-containing protein [Sphingobium sp. V4]WIW89505.1 MaoC family dehydratase N-terminal domain-containing protein [Sphingobium sp. V4]
MAEAEYTITVGTEEEGRRLIGTSTPPRKGGVAVNDGMIRLLCSSVEDGNPRYWGGGECPPGMLYTWIQEMPWAPGQAVRGRVMAVTIPLPGNQVVNAGQKVEFHETIRVGDTLSIVETLESISEEKSTPLGRGHFVVTRADISREDGTIVASVVNNLFRYRAS